MMQTYQYYDPQTGESLTNQPNRRPDRKNGKGLLRTIAYAVIFGLIAGIVFTGVSFAGSKLVGRDAKNSGQTAVTSEAKKSDKDKTDTILQTTSTANSNASIADTVEAVMPSVVSITSMSVKEVESFFGSQLQEAKSAGSGIILGENDDELLIATNNHVVEGSQQMTVTFNDGESVEASVKGTDKKLDLAVVAVKKENVPDSTKKAIKVATMGESSNARVGDSVIAIGNALGYGQSVTTGIISATERSIDDVSGKYIQTDAAINPGNSGGALLNSNGEIIGINSAKIQDTSVEGMGYAIPISDVKEILQTLMNKETRDKVAEGEQGYLGIVGRTVDEQTAQMYSIPTGVYVTEVDANGAAAQAGIKESDIITSFDGADITGMDELQSLLKTYKAGETIKVGVAKESAGGQYKEKTVTVTLGAREQ